MHCITCTLAEPGTTSRVALSAARGKLKKSAPEQHVSVGSRDPVISIRGAGTLVQPLPV
jgi:hypothetical protein